MHKKLQVELIDKCLDTAMSSLQGQDSIAETLDKNETQTPKAKAPKNCLEARHCLEA